MKIKMLLDKAQRLIWIMTNLKSCNSNRQKWQIEKFKKMKKALEL